MSRIGDILSRHGSNWKVLQPPLTADVIADGLKRIGRALPEELIELYHECNGGAGSLPFTPWRFALWGLDFAVQVYEDEHYRSFYGPFVFFGTSGGGDYFGLDPSGHVFVMDPVAG